MSRSMSRSLSCGSESRAKAWKAESDLSMGGRLRSRPMSA
jgi:hypothetical protein